MTVSDRYSDTKVAVGAPLFSKVETAKVLMVGAGGIGCELIKNLVLTGFRDITIIDLDTIDVSNLNRQFLFRREHVGKSKAQIARESALKINSSAEITAHHGNVKDSQFDSDFFKSFTIILNALDNLSARQHVNRMCVAAGVTLIESGTQGFLGQVQTISNDPDQRSECFECQAHPTPKTFAVCTLRNTPDKPHHCVVWSTTIFNVFFGPPDDMSSFNDLKIDLTKIQEENLDKVVNDVFTALFTTEIEKQLTEEAKERWKGTSPPVPHKLPELQKADDWKTPASDHDVPTISQSAKLFISSLTQLLGERRSTIGTITFDKDDDLALDFVTAATNLRSASYSIPLLSKFKLKGVAGNIIHAIATTNAIAAGLIVMETLKVLDGRIQDCKTTWIKRSGPKILQPQDLDKPSSECIVCGQAKISLKVHLNKMTLRNFYVAFLKGNVGVIEPSMDNVTTGRYFGCMEDIEDVLDKTLKELKFNDGDILSICDDEQSMEFNVLISAAKEDELNEEEHPDGFLVVGKLSTSTSTSTSSGSGGTSPTPTKTTATSTSTAKNKRPLSPSPNSPSSSIKKAKTDADNCILIVENDDEIEVL